MSEGRFEKQKADSHRKDRLDGHDNGIRIVSKWLADAGFEVIYLGLYNTPAGIVRAVIQENADLIVCSFLGGRTSLLPR
jgi:methylmalonyl-CoA mutase C-terminal domain/subunit